jgi:hypothetical protein
VVTAVEAGPLDAEVIDLEMNAAPFAVARLARGRAFWAGRVAAPILIIAKLEPVFAAEVEGVHWRVLADASLSMCSRTKSGMFGSGRDAASVWAPSP